MAAPFHVSWSRRRNTMQRTVRLCLPGGGHSLEPDAEYRKTPKFRRFQGIGSDRKHCGKTAKNAVAFSTDGCYNSFHRRERQAVILFLKAVLITKRIKSLKKLLTQQDALDIIQKLRHGDGTKQRAPLPGRGGRGITAETLKGRADEH